jgi:hypothetical protein
VGVEAMAMAMNYSSEIRSVMDQAHTLWAQIGKSDKHEDGIGA